MVEVHKFKVDEFLHHSGPGAWFESRGGNIPYPDSSFGAEAESGLPAARHQRCPYRAAMPQPPRRAGVSTDAFWRRGSPLRHRSYSNLHVVVFAGRAQGEKCHMLLPVLPARGANGGIRFGRGNSSLESQSCDSAAIEPMARLQ